MPCCLILSADRDYLNPDACLTLAFLPYPGGTGRVPCIPLPATTPHTFAGGPTHTYSSFPQPTYPPHPDLPGTCLLPPHSQPDGLAQPIFIVLLGIDWTGGYLHTACPSEQTGLHYCFVVVVFGLPLPCPDGGGGPEGPQAPSPSHQPYPHPYLPSVPCLGDMVLLSQPTTA